MLTEREAALLLSTQEKKIAKAFRWKAENIVRFFRGLNMTEEEKVDFLSHELASVYLYDAKMYVCNTGRVQEKE